MGFEVSFLSVTLSLLPVACNQRVRATSPAPRLPAYPPHDDNGLNLGTVSEPQLNVFFVRVVIVLESLHSNRRHTLQLRKLRLKNGRYGPKATAVNTGRVTHQLVHPSPHLLKSWAV